MLSEMPDVKIAAVCDLFDDRMAAAADIAEKNQGSPCDRCADYRQLLARDDIEAVLIASSWSTHITIAIDSMKAGKYTACEVGGASSLDECWELVKVSESTGIHCMLLENCNYNREELALLRMAKEGIFGELIHCECGYQHDCRDLILSDSNSYNFRLNHYQHRNGDLYPTHGLGPMAKILGINRGNRMVSLTSMSTKSRGLKEWAAAHLGTDHPRGMPRLFTG